MGTAAAIYNYDMNNDYKKNTQILFDSITESIIGSIHYAVLTLI